METGAMQALYERLLPLFSKKQLMENVPMSRYTTLHLGGPAQLLCEPDGPEQLSAAFQAARVERQESAARKNGQRKWPGADLAAQ